MNKYILITVLVMGTYLLNAQNTLRVRITNLRNDKGNVSIQLLDKDNKSVAGKTQVIKDKIAVFTFTNLKAGKYAVQYFHDENSNKELDTNFIGIPKEGYGFSNNAYGNFGPKDFEEWLFEVKGDTKIVLKTNY